jgi:predicted Zn-dependent protease
MTNKIYHKTFQNGSADIALLVAFCLFFLLAGGSFIYFSLYGNPPISAEKTLQKTIAITAPVISYTADVFIQPEGSVSQDTIINGTVSFDTIANSESGIFSFPAIPKLKIETRVFSDGSFLKYVLEETATSSKTVSYPSDWMTISDSEVGPDEFVVLRDSLAFADVLELFRKGGKYLVVDGMADKQIKGTESEIHFVLRPSVIESNHPSDVSKNFDALLKEGKVNVWVASKDKRVKEIRFVAGGYAVTVKIKNINTSVNIEKPETALSLSDWRVKQFSEFNLKSPVSEIFIGSYGTIKKEYLEAINTAIKKETGIKPTILVAGAELPKTAPLYNPEKGKFDAEVAFESVKMSSAKYGDKTRFIYVLDVDTYSSKENAVSVWGVSEIGTNATVISLFGLRKTSDEDSVSAPQPLVIARAQKVALHALGESVGFGLSPSTENSACLMYKTNSLANLDAEGTGYCLAEKTVIKKFFGK